MVPKDCRVFLNNGETVSLHGLWNRRQSTKFNGVSYPVQKAAEAVYTREGQAQISELIAGYLENADIIGKTMVDLGFEYVGRQFPLYLGGRPGPGFLGFF